MRQTLPVMRSTNNCCPPDCRHRHYWYRVVTGVRALKDLLQSPEAHAVSGLFCLCSTNFLCEFLCDPYRSTTRRCETATQGEGVNFFAP